MVKANTLLIAGDSIDRYITQDWCQLHHGNFGSWGPGSIRYHTHTNGYIIPAGMCKNSIGDQIASVHIFGASSIGPYHMGLHSTPGDPEFIDTKNRLPAILTAYFNEFKTYPDRFVYHTGEWDLPQEYRVLEDTVRDAQDWNATLLEFQINTLDRVKELKSFIFENGLSVDLCLRTIGWTKESGRLLHLMNQMIRDIADSHKLSLYDLNLDIWASVGFNKSRESEIFRDHVHPQAFATASAGDKLLGKRYSAYMRFKDGESIFSNPALPGALDKSHICGNGFLSSQFSSSHLHLNVIENHIPLMISKCPNFFVNFISFAPFDKFYSVTRNQDQLKLNISSPLISPHILNDSAFSVSASFSQPQSNNSTDHHFDTPLISSSNARSHPLPGPLSFSLPPDTYFVSFVNGSLVRWGPIFQIETITSLLSSTKAYPYPYPYPPLIFSQFYYSLADVLFLPASTMDDIPLVSPIPPDEFFTLSQFHDCSSISPTPPPPLPTSFLIQPVGCNQCVQTSSHQIYYRLYHGYSIIPQTSIEACLKISQNSSFSALNLKNSPFLIQSIISDFWLDFPGTNPNTFLLKNGDLIKFPGNRQVFVVEDAMKLPIPNLDVFVAHGWDFDITPVRELAPSQFDLLPSGPDLS